MPAGVPHPVSKTRRLTEARRRPDATRRRRYKSSHHGDAHSAEREATDARPLAELGAPDRPEPWEAVAVDLTALSNAEKNRAWRNIKANDPELTASLQRDMPQFKKHWPGIRIWVPREYTTNGDNK